MQLDNKNKKETHTPLLLLLLRDKLAASPKRKSPPAMTNAKFELLSDRSSTHIIDDSSSALNGVKAIEDCDNGGTNI